MKGFDMKNLTPKQMAQKFKTKNVTFSLGDIQFYRDQGRTVWIDNRTTHKLEPAAAIVYPFALDDIHVYIVCPYCGEIHAHGSAKGDYEGMRVSHCHTPYHANYYIKAL